MGEEPGGEPLPMDGSETLQKFRGLGTEVKGDLAAHLLFPRLTFSSLPSAFGNRVLFLVAHFDVEIVACSPIMPVACSGKMPTIHLQ